MLKPTLYVETWKETLRRSNDHNVKGFLIEATNENFVISKSCTRGWTRDFLNTHLYFHILGSYAYVGGVQVQWCVSRIEIEFESRIWSMVLPKLLWKIDALDNALWSITFLQSFTLSNKIFALETRSKVHEANVDTFNHVESSNGWIRALEAWACKQLRNKTKEFQTVEIIVEERCWSSLWNQRFYSSQSSVIGGTLSSSIIVEVDNVIVDSTWVICQWNPNLRPVLTISCL